MSGLLARKRHAKHSPFLAQLILTLWQLELFHEASKFMLRTAIRIILGEVIYNKYRDELVEDFRTLEIDGKID